MNIIQPQREAYEMGLCTFEYAFDRIVDGYFAANGGFMTEADMANVVDDVEAAGWFEMAHFIHGYYWGASIDDENELKGEALLNARIAS